jgi:hypothetical protein
LCKGTIIAALEKEYACDCATEGCEMHVLHRLPSSIRVDGDDKYSTNRLKRFASVQTVVQDSRVASVAKVAASISRSCDEESHEESDESNSKSQSCDDESDNESDDSINDNDVSCQVNFKRLIACIDSEPIKLFTKASHFTRNDLVALMISANVKAEKLLMRPLISASISPLTIHVQYMIEVFLLNQCSEMATLLMWIADVTNQSKSWDINKEKSLCASLNKFKLAVINRLITLEIDRHKQ